MNADTSSSQDSSETRTPGNWILIAGIAVGAVWAAGVSAFLIGYGGGGGLGQAEPDRLAGLAFIALAPAVAFAMLGWAGREILGFARTARLLEYSARRLSAPVSNVKADARSVADAIAEQVERLNRDTEGALARLAAMEEVLRHHAESVHAASGETRNQVDGLIEDLRRERGAIGDLSEHLRLEAAKISETIDKQSEVVTTASSVASAQAQEGRALLDTSAAAMTGAAGAAQKAAERAALAIDEQLRDMQALVTALDDRGGRLEEVARIHSENVKIVQQTAHDLNMAADAGSEAMKATSETAIEQARRLAEIIETETDRAVERGMEEIERMRRAAQAARESAESAGLALEANADAVIERVRAANASTLSGDRALHRTEARRAETRQGEPRRGDASRLERGRVESHRAPARHVDDDWLDDTPPDRRGELRADPRAESREHAHYDERDAEADHAPAPSSSRRRSARYSVPPPSRQFDDHEDGYDEDRNGRSAHHDDLDDDLDAPARASGHGAGHRADHADDHDAADDGEWRWRDLLKNVDETPNGALAGEAVVSGLRRAGIEPGRALDPDTTARVARARRRAGPGEARALVVDGALSEVRRTAAALAADPSLRNRAEDFVDEHSRLVRRAIDENDAGSLSALLDSDSGRAYLLLDAAMADS